MNETTPTTTTEIIALPPAERAALALNSTKTEALAPASSQPEPVEVAAPVTVAANINTTPEQAPSASALAAVIAFEYGIEIAHATRWLAQRADEFKTLAESQA